MPGTEMEGLWIWGFFREGKRDHERRYFELEKEKWGYGLF